MTKANVAAWVAVFISIAYSLIAGGGRFSSLETRIAALERSYSTSESERATMVDQLNTISNQLAHVEGQLDEARAERQTDRDRTR